MALNIYPDIQSSTDFLRFEFESKGIKRLQKLVRLDLIDPIESIYNLALCTLLPNGNEDCETASRNGDMDVVLKTTAYIAILFLNKFPHRKIYFQGSDVVRTRKYQIGIRRYLSEIINDYAIEGIVIDESGIIVREHYQSKNNYTGFNISLKND